MKLFVKSYFVVMFLSVAMFSSCMTDNVNRPEYHSEILMDDDLNIIDMRHSGQSTNDGKYYYYGSVTLYNKDGNSRTFSCYQGKKGMEAGCRGIIYGGEFYYLDRNEWVTIDGVKYRASN